VREKTATSIIISTARKQGENPGVEHTARDDQHRLYLKMYRIKLRGEEALTYAEILDEDHEREKLLSCAITGHLEIVHNQEPLPSPHPISKVLSSTYNP
jgi:hypothetical protein